MLVQSTTKSFVILYFPSEKAPAPPKPLIIEQLLQEIQLFIFFPSIGHFLLASSCPASKPLFAVRILLDKLICSEDTSRSCSNDYHIIIIHLSIASHNTLLFVRPRWRTPIIYDTIFFLYRKSNLYIPANLPADSQVLHIALQAWIP